MMARITAVHLLATFTVLCFVYLSHVCLACPKHKHAQNNAQSPEAAETQKGKGDSAASLDAAPTASPSLRGAPEQTENFSIVLQSKDIQAQVEDIVQRAVKQLSAHDVLPVLNEVEGHARGALRHAAQRVCSDEEEDSSVAVFLMTLVRLLSAIKAVRADITNVDLAWVQLKDSIRNLAEAERAQPDLPGKAAEVLVEFLEAEMWMNMKTAVLQNSARVLKDLLGDKDVMYAVSSSDPAGDIVSKLTEALVLS